MSGDAGLFHLEVAENKGDGGRLRYEGVAVTAIFLQSCLEY